MGLYTERDEHERSSAFTRRTLLLGVGATAVLSGLVVRMYQLQILEADRYRTLAEDNRINLQLLPPPASTPPGQKSAVRASPRFRPAIPASESPSKCLHCSELFILYHICRQVFQWAQKNG